MPVTFAVKKSVVPPACGSYETLQDAIDNPAHIATDWFEENIALNIAGDEYAAVVQYNELPDGGTIYAAANNFSALGETMWVYIVEGDGDVFDTVILTGFAPSEIVSIPASAPFYAVVRNFNDGECDNIEFELEGGPGPGPGPGP